MALFKTFSADGDSDIMQIRGPAHIHASGTFGSGTLTGYYLSQAGTYKAIANAVFTSANDLFVAFPEHVQTTIKFTLSGSTAPSLYLEVRAPT